MKLYDVITDPFARMVGLHPAAVAIAAVLAAAIVTAAVLLLLRKRRKGKK